MAGQSSQDFLQQTVNSFAQRVNEYADGIANRLGQPLSGRQLTQDEVLARWNFSPLGSTSQADQAYHQMVAQGTPPGQALDQVYPMRSMLFRGPDLKSAISTAKQIQGWAADASGQDVPEGPQGSTLPMALIQQRNAMQAAPPQAPALPMPQAAPMPMPPPSPMPMPMPQASPMGAPSVPMPPPQPLPQVT